jgi:hypothetical protein
MKRFTPTTVLAVPALLLCIAIGCQGPDEPDFSNPLDPTDPDFVPPVATITNGPDEGATVTSADVSFTWSGVDRVDAYRYRLDGSEWSDWQLTTTVEFQLLDEEDHVFELMARYPTGTKQTTPTKRAFIVDAVKGSALMFRPRRIVVAAGDTFSVDVIAEEVEDLMGVRVRGTYDPQMLRLRNVVQGDFLAENGGKVVFPDGRDDGVLTGVLAFDTAVAAGTPRGVNGSGSVATLSFLAQEEGETTLSVGVDSVLRDSQNQPITLNDRVVGVVVVQGQTQ